MKEKKIKIKEPEHKEEIKEEKKEKIKKAVAGFNVSIPSVSFLDKAGKEVFIDKILEPNDYWLNKSRRGDNWIVSHLGVEKVAAAGGVKKQINTSFRIEVQPTYENGMNHQVVGTMFCRGVDTEGDECVHGSDPVFYSTGEASRQNTNARGGSYMRVMAEKRAYDRGVLDHLGLKNKLNIYSEDEADAFEQEKAKPIDQVIEKLSPVLNKIINAKTLDELNVVASEIKTMTLEKDEVEYLRGVWSRKRSELNPAF